MADSGFVSVFDSVLLRPLKKIYWPSLRWLFFAGFGWLGCLKLFGQAAVAPVTLSFIADFSPLPQAETLLVWGVFELLIAVAFLVKGFERLAVSLLAMYIVVTVVVMALYAGQLWETWLVPTVEGLYMVQSLASLIVAAGVAAYLAPVKKKKKTKSEDKD